MIVFPTRKKGSLQGDITFFSRFQIPPPGTMFFGYLNTHKGVCYSEMRGIATYDKQLE